MKCILGIIIVGYYSILFGLLQRVSSSVHRRHIGVSQEFYKHVAPDYLVRGTEFPPLRLSNKKIITTIAVWCE